MAVLFVALPAAHRSCIRSRLELEATILANRAAQVASIDFFTPPTATFRVLLVLLVLSHDRRRVVHGIVTAFAMAVWTAQQFREAWPWDEAPRFVVRAEACCVAARCSFG